MVQRGFLDESEKPVVIIADPAASHAVHASGKQLELDATLR
jgi:hypothetical protein